MAEGRGYTASSTLSSLCVCISTSLLSSPSATCQELSSNIYTMNNNTNYKAKNSIKVIRTFLSPILRWKMITSMNSKFSIIYYATNSIIRGKKYMKTLMTDFNLIFFFHLRFASTKNLATSFSQESASNLNYSLTDL